MAGSDERPSSIGGVFAPRRSNEQTTAHDMVSPPKQLVLSILAMANMSSRLVNEHFGWQKRKQEQEVR
jgi:hypothetical protein